MEIIAHRGASYDAPENTFAAINLAWEQDADAIEIDVHLSRDGKLVVIHDDNTGKVAGVKKVVCNQTFGDLCALDVGRWKGKQWTGEKIPTLDQVLATIPDDKRVFVEIKCGAESVQEFEEAWRRSRKESRQVAVLGFALFTAALFKSKLPELEVCWNVEFKRNWKTGRWTPALDEFIREATRAGLDGLSFGAKGPLTRKVVERVKGAGLKVYVWTVDSVTKARELAAAGVDGIITNRPGRLRKQLGHEPRSAHQEFNALTLNVSRAIP